jgi:hypothetical protein
MPVLKENRTILYPDSDHTSICRLARHFDADGANPDRQVVRQPEYDLSKVCATYRTDIFCRQGITLIVAINETNDHRRWLGRRKMQNKDNHSCVAIRAEI